MIKLDALKKRIYVIIGIIFAGILIAALCILYQFYGIKQKEEQNKQLQVMEIYMKNLEGSLDNCEKFIARQCMDNVFIQNMLQPENETVRYVALETKKNELKEELPRYHLLDGIFVYDSTQEQYLGIKGDLADGVYSAYIQKNIKDIIEKYHAENIKDEWLPIKIGKSYCIFYIVEVREIYFCAWMLPDNMIADLQETVVLPEEYYYIGNTHGIILNHNDELEIPDWTPDKVKKLYSDGYSCMEKESQEQKFFLLRVVRAEKYADFLSYFLLPFLVLVIILAVLYVLVLAITKRGVWYPVKTYLMEEELKKQKVELQFLQIQISPHFLNNCLSLIRNLICLERYEDAENAAVILSRYTRGSFDARTEITLAEEIEQVKVYYDLQKLRFGKQLELELKIGEHLSSCMVPTTVIQGFVSNSVKYQMRKDKPLQIFVSVRENEDKQLHIMIKDSGVGFSESILEQLKKGEPITDSAGMSHIGIYNITQRLSILYKDAATIEFYNGQTGGSVVEVTIPVKYDRQR